MKIVMFGHKRIPSREGGVEIVVESLSTRMTRLGHSVTCYNRKGHHVGGSDFDSGKQRKYKGVDIRTVPTVDKKGLAAVSSSFFAGIASAFSGADVVHIHAEGPAFMCWLPRLFGKKVIVTVHGLDWQREKWKRGFGAKYIRWGERAAVRYAHEIIVLSKNVQTYFRQTYGRETLLIPNGVTEPGIVPAKKIQEQFALEKDSYILFLGRLVPEKGVHLLLDAFKSLKTDKKLVIAGSTSDTDDYVKALREQAAEDERVLFTGFVQGRLLEELYSNAFVYCLPSLLEGMPLSLLEAMSYGNCCLVSDIAECTEAVEDRAAIFRCNQVADLTEKLQELCDNPGMVAAFKENARRFICQKYNWDAVTERTLEAYQ